VTGNVTGNLTGNVTGNVTGNCSGTAATVTGATQASITTCANLTTIGTLAAGAVPASLVTAGTFPAGAFVFQGAVSGITTLTCNAATVYGSTTSYRVYIGTAYDTCLFLSTGATGNPTQVFRQGTTERCYQFYRNADAAHVLQNLEGNIEFEPKSGSTARSVGGFDVANGKVYKVNSVQVVGAQGAAVADATDAASTQARLNDLLARVRAHGLIAT
jgi:hypothetical protein